MTFEQKCEAVQNAQCNMPSSRDLCLRDAKQLQASGHPEHADVRLEKAAQYAWGFNRPTGWVKYQVVARKE